MMPPWQVFVYFGRPISCDHDRFAILFFKKNAQQHFFIGEIVNFVGNEPVRRTLYYLRRQQDSISNLPFGDISFFHLK